MPDNFRKIADSKILFIAKNVRGLLRTQEIVSI